MYRAFKKDTFFRSHHVIIPWEFDESTVIAARIKGSIKKAFQLCAGMQMKQMPTLKKAYSRKIIATDDASK